MFVLSITTKEANATEEVNHSFCENQELAMYSVAKKVTAHPKAEVTWSLSNEDEILMVGEAQNGLVKARYKNNENHNPPWKEVAFNVDDL